MQTLESLDEKRDEKKDESSSLGASHISAKSIVVPTLQKNRLILCLLLFLATLLLYNPVTRAPFLNYDDPIYVTDNLHLRAGITWRSIGWAFRLPDELDWHPITWLCYILEFQLFGSNPSGFHVVNVLLHAANAVLLFWILERASALPWRSLAVAALFALHPMNVESVAWISELKNVLSMFFFLIALGAYGWYARRPGLGRYMAVTIAYIFALMSKAQAITFPFAVLLLDYWPLYRLGGPHEEVAVKAAVPVPQTSFRSLLWEKVPWLGLSIFSALMTLRGSQAFSYITGMPVVALPLRIRLENAAISYAAYLAKIFWPAHLALMYPHPGFAVSTYRAIFSALILAAITILAVIHRHHRPLFFGWFWFLVTLLPMSGLVLIGPHASADRYAYIPLLGIFVILCWGAADLIDRWRVPLAVVAVCAAVVLTALGLSLRRQVNFWNDNVTLWNHTLQVTGANFTAEENLALALIDQGKIGEALPHLYRAQSLQPHDPLSTLNIATYDQMRGNYEAALAGFTNVIQFPYTAHPMRAVAFANSGYAHLSLHKYTSAKQDFESALRENANNSAAYRGMGLLAQRSGDLTEAVRNYELAVELQPSSVGYLLLAHARELGLQPEAGRAAESQAIRLTRDINDEIAVARQLLRDCCSNDQP